MPLKEVEEQEKNLRKEKFEDSTANNSRVAEIKWKFIITLNVVNLFNRSVN
jgi:hypothetical protein